MRDWQHGKRRWMGAFIAIVILAAATSAFADHLSELIVFDQTNAEKKFDEGLVRQHLGLLNADGKPALPLVPLVSADGLRAAYDMNGAGTNPSFDTRLTELRTDAGTLIVMTHGNLGVLTMENRLVKGFGAGTGAGDACANAALPVTRALTNATIRMAVCHAGKSSGTVTSVAQSLRDAIVAAGGSVSTMTASVDPVQININQRVRVRNGYDPTVAELTAALAAANAYSAAGKAMKDQYKDYQAALDVAAPPDLQGSKIIAVLKYEGVIDTFTLTKTRSTHPDPHVRALEDFEKIITDTECVEGCGPVDVQPSTWSGLKNRYR